LRAWRALPRFEGRSSVRTWLFKIATNTAIDTATRRGRRELPVSFGPPTGAGLDPGPELHEVPWMEPYPDAFFGVSETPASPEARYEQRESVELAFVSALQHLPAQQRGVLILRDVLGFSAREVAEMLETSVAAANSSLQRARVAATALPQSSQQETLRTLGDLEVDDLASRYSQAIENGDIDALLSMLTEDASWSMPPVAGWYRGREAIATFMRDDVFPQRWRHLTTRANGQLAVGCFLLDDGRGCYVGHVLDVLTLDGDRIAQVTGFLTAEATGTDNRFVGAHAFPRFGLPSELPA
jgi:RNA polymerase sigma-70 factor, ECF subfamily